jgi:ketosteroid isomerase-like protein
LQPYRIEGKAAIKDFFATLFEIWATRHGAARGASTRVYANDTVVVSDGYTAINYTDKNGNHSAIFTRNSTTWVKMGNEWKIVDQHISQFRPSP